MWRQQYVLKRTKGTTNLLPFPILKEALEKGLKRGRQGGQAGCWTRARWEGQGWGASWGVWFPSGSVHLHSWAWPNKYRSNRLLQAQGLKARIGKTQNWLFLSGHPAQSLLFPPPSLPHSLPPSPDPHQQRHRPHAHMARAHRGSMQRQLSSQPSPCSAETHCARWARLRHYVVPAGWAWARESQAAAKRPCLLRASGLCHQCDSWAASKQRPV